MHRRQLASQLTRASHRFAPHCALTRRSSSSGGSSSGGSSTGGQDARRALAALADKTHGEKQQQQQLLQLQQQQFYHAEANLIAKGVQLITGFRRWGHLAAQTDPLGLAGPTPDEVPASLRLESYNFTAAQLASERPMDVSGAVFDATGSHGFSATERALPLRALHRRLSEVYAGSVGVEYMHIKDQAQRGWLRDQLETVQPPSPTQAERMHALKDLCWADAWSSFCSQHFRRTKRFGLEGSESLVVGMNEVVERAGELGAEYVVVGMPHRGRLNVLANVARKPLEQIFREFRGGVHGTAVDDAEWRGIIMATFEQLCSEGRDGRLRADELHGALTLTLTLIPTITLTPTLALTLTR